MTSITLPEFVQEIARRAKDKDRILVAIAGSPGSGKSTFAQELSDCLGPAAAIVPMDGFHFDNDHLHDIGLFDRKGAPDTFDVKGLRRLLAQLKTTPSITYPTFDRAADRTVPNGGAVRKNSKIILVEGNYLLLDTSNWSDLADLFDLTLRLHVDRKVLEDRLVTRWIDHGISPKDARTRALNNDMKNVDFVERNSRDPDFMYRQT